jgi:hypothetical protein
VGNAWDCWYPNDAGKSTLIRSIVGRVIPDDGTISVFGSAADSAEARLALGWVPQELALYSRLTSRKTWNRSGDTTGSRAACSGKPCSGHLPGPCFGRFQTRIHDDIVRICLDDRSGQHRCQQSTSMSFVNRHNHIS